MKNRKLIASGLCLFIFIISFSSLINVGYAADPNIEIISESDLSTRWDFINETAGYNYLYNETFDAGSDNWSLYGVSERYFIGAPPTYLFMNYSGIVEYTEETIVIEPDGDISDEWDIPVAPAVHADDLDDGVIYPSTVGFDGNRVISSTVSQTDIYSFDNINLSAYDSGKVIQIIYPIYHKTIYAGPNQLEVSGNLPGTTNPIYTWFSSYIFVWKYAGGWSDLNLTDADINTLEITTKHLRDFTFTIEASQIIVNFEGNASTWYISKNYQGNNFIYMQTNETETLTYRSPNDLNLTLYEGDKIEVKFNTSSTNRIDLNLRNNSIQQESYILSSQGNGDFSTRTKTFTISSNISVDQIEFTGIFDDTKNLIVDSIIIKRGYAETYNYYVEPYGRKQLDIGYPHNYTVEIYERNELMETKYIITSSTLQTLIYERIDFEIVYLTYYDSNNEYLDFNLFVTYINYTLDNFTYTNERLSSHILYVDDNTLIEFKIYDSFDILIKDYNSYEETFIDITLNVYSLKIKNEASEYADYILKNNNSGIEKSGNIFPTEIIEFSIATGNYILNYTNYEDNYPRSLEFEFTTHKIITINTTYHQIYFGLFTYDGLGLNRDWVRFYINNVRKDFGRNIIQSETAELIVLDYFNNTLANETIDASAYSEYNIYIQVYSMYLLNQFTYDDLIMNITQVGSGYNMTQLIPATSALLYRFIPNVNYTINATYVNGTVYNIRTINLTENNQIESFGTPTRPSEYPKDVYFGIYTTTGLGLDHDLLRFYIDGNRTDFGFNRITDEIITIVVKDFFNTTLIDQIINTSGIYEYDILITLYSLKVKNEARVSANYTLKLGGLETTGFILPEEIIQYQLASNNYVFDYTNNEDSSSDTININLNQDMVYILNTTYYTTYFSLYNQSGLRLDDSLFSLFLNNTRKDFGFVELQSLDVLIVVQDYLNFTVFNSVITLSGSTEYNIIITVYELQIRHLAQVNSNFTMFETTTFNYIDFSMSPDSLNKYILSDSTYNITWVNGENSVSTTYNITLDENFILTLNTTYYDVYIGLYNFYGVVNREEVKFYINNTRADFGFNTIKSDYADLLVMDYFNSTLFHQIVYLQGLSEYSIFIRAYTLIVNNLYNNQSITIRITRGSITIERLIEAQGWTEFKLFANITYEIISYVNGTNNETNEVELIEDEIKEVELDEEYKIVSFGFYEIEVPVIPDPLDTSTRNTITTIILISVIGSVGIVLYLQTRGATDRSVRATTHGEYNAYGSINWGRIGLVVLGGTFIVILSLVFFAIII